MVDGSGWFAVRCFVLHGPPDEDVRTYEERVTLWRAATAEAAFDLAEAEAEEYAATLADAVALSPMQSYELTDHPGHGAELFSLMRDSPLDPETYVRTYFSTGGERQTAIGPAGAPPSFAERYSTAWSRWVLEHGLPGLPDRLEDGSSVPVAWWEGPDSAAVLHLRRGPGEHGGEPGTEVDVEVFERVAGSWEGAGGGGAGGWADPVLRRVAVPDRRADLTGTVRVRQGGSELLAWWGEVGGAAATIEVEQDGVVTRRPLVAPLGWAVACAAVGGAAVVRVRDADGQLLTEVGSGAQP